MMQRCAFQLAAPLFSARRPLVRVSRSARRTFSATMATPAAISAQPGVKTIEKQPVRTPIGPDSTVLVVGASRGIGLEFAAQCASKGAQVYATVRGTQLPRGIKALQAKHGDLLRTVSVDVTGKVDALRQVPLGEVTHVIHNAGVVGTRFGLQETTAEEMEHLFSVNTVGVLSVAQLVAPQMRRHGGRLPVYGVLSSKVGSVDDNGSGGMYAYRASKAACNIIVKNLAIDFGGRVAFVLLHPGYVRTDMTGGGGLINADESVRGMLKAVEATAADVGFRFVDYKAELIPW